MENIALLLDLILRGAAQLQQYATLVKTARAEGRDVSAAELATLKDAYAAERAELQALIDARS